jgi:hypothetical protein
MLVVLLTIDILVRDKDQSNNPILLNSSSQYHCITLGLIKRINDNPVSIWLPLIAFFDKSTIGPRITIVAIDCIIGIEFSDEFEIIQFEYTFYRCCIIGMNLVYYEFSCYFYNLLT